MQWSDIPFSPSVKTLRQFAGLWLIVFSALGAWQHFGRGRTTVAIALVALAVTLGPLGLARPQFIRPIFVGWMILAFPIGWTVSFVLMAFLYYGLITPLGLVFRLAGRDALTLKRRPEKQSYWTPKPVTSDIKRYLREF
jgi:hypothetical protein